MNYFAASDTGKVRKTNEDCLFASDSIVGRLPNLYIVADGMGGQNAGEIASRMAIAEAIRSINESPYSSVFEIFNHAISEANIQIITKSRNNINLEGMGTTMTMCSVNGDSLYVANIGDSRLYVIRDRLIQITKDHSLVEELALEGKIERNSEFYNSRRNIITRALGIKEEVVSDLFEFDMEKGDLILMCTDGLTTMLSDEIIFKIIKESNGLSNMAQQLIIKSKEKGGLDNVSVILIDPEIMR